MKKWWKNVSDWTGETIIKYSRRFNAPFIGALLLALPQISGCAALFWLSFSRYTSDINPILAISFASATFILAAMQAFLATDHLIQKFNQIRNA
jgi:hypothetical protein